MDFRKNRTKSNTEQVNQTDYVCHNCANSQFSNHAPRSCHFGAEFFGTLVFVFLGQAALTSFELTGTQNDTITRQSATTIAYSLAYLLAILLTISSSGAHLNPAYSIARATYGYINWSLALKYILAQYSGAFSAAFFVHMTYSDKLAQRHSIGSLVGKNSTLKAHGHPLSTGKLFSSYPPTEVTMFQLIFSYIMASTFFFLLIIAIQESKPLRLSNQVKPIYMASALALVLVAFSANGGPVLNPAQDFSPRLYTALVGWGSSAFNLHQYQYFWICGIVAPHIGAILGFSIYQLLDRLGNQNITTDDYTSDDDT